MGETEMVLSKQLIINVMKATGTNQNMLAGLVGMKNQSNVSEALKRDMKFSLLAKMIESMGCEIVIKSKNGEKEWVVADNSVEMTKGKKEA